jgi:hypothetical protein
MEQRQVLPDRVRTQRREQEDGGRTHLALRERIDV